MPVTRALPWIITAIVASVSAFLSGVHAGQMWLSWTALLLFGFALVATSADMNSAWTKGAHSARDSEAASIAALRNARLMTLAYLWGGVAMVTIYRVTDIFWQHGMQYAMGLAMIGLLHHAYANQVSNPSSLLRRPKLLRLATVLAALHGAAALIGLAYLLGSGKVWSIKPDWPANQIFVSGGLTVAALSAIAVATQLRLLKLQTAPTQGTVQNSDQNSVQNSITATDP